MAIERNPAYALFIGSFEADEHAALMASTDARYLAWREDGRLLAFAILQKLDDPNRVVLLKRIAAAKKALAAVESRIYAMAAVEPMLIDYDPATGVETWLGGHTTIGNEVIDGAIGEDESK